MSKMTNGPQPSQLPGCKGHNCHTKDDAGTIYHHKGCPYRIRGTDFVCILVPGVFLWNLDQPSMALLGCPQ
jgi:hypothetical protein